jgi:hypothetical protein
LFISEQLKKECENFSCPLDFVGGAVVPGNATVGAEAVVVCHQGYLLDFNAEKGRLKAALRSIYTI